MRRWTWTIFAIVGLILLFASMHLWANPTVNTDEMVGAKRCGQCHKSAYEVWKTTRHSRANKALDSHQAKDPRCMQCHGTTSERTGGVQCEECHGPGKHYAYSYVMKDKVLSRLVGLNIPKHEVCGRCHTDSTPSIRTFDFSTMWGIVNHGLDQ